MTVKDKQTDQQIMNDASPHIYTELMLKITFHITWGFTYDDRNMTPCIAANIHGSVTLSSVVYMVFLAGIDK